MAAVVCEEGFQVRRSPLKRTISDNTSRYRSKLRSRAKRTNTFSQHDEEKSEEGQSLLTSTLYLSQYLNEEGTIPPDTITTRVSRSASVRSTSARFYSSGFSPARRRHRYNNRLSSDSCKRSLSFRSVKNDSFLDSSFDRLNRSESSATLLVSSSSCYRMVSSKVVTVKRCSSLAKVALGRKPSTVQGNKVRRCSEPFLLDPLLIQSRSRKVSSNTRYGKRRQSSTTVALPSTSKQKLHELAKDELLASLNVPQPDETSPELPSVADSLENVAQTAENERRQLKRHHVIVEILETEKNYISCLETLDTVFKKQLENTTIITAKELSQLFPAELSEIHISHSWFAQELQERINNDNWKGIIGDIFAKMTSATANLLEIYTNYVNSFPKSISTLSKCSRSSQKFRKFLEECYENPKVERLDLPSFLLSPVQRLPRYILLLRELLKYTEKEHPDRYFIGEAKKEMESMISSLNSSIHSSMEFYSANKRKKSKFKNKRKNIRNLTNRSLKKEGDAVTPESREADQGYCSFSERKDEDESNSLEHPHQRSRSSTWLSKRSVSVASSMSAPESQVVLRRRKESSFLRNNPARKSWRRSLGAVFSNLWSTREEITESGVHTPEEDQPSLETIPFPASPIDTLDAPPATPSIETNPEVRVDSPIQRNISNTSSRSSVCSPTFKRGKLRGSAGPVLRSIFNRNNTKLEKALSWNDLKSAQNNNNSSPSIKKQHRRSISLRMFKFSSKDSINSKIVQGDEQTPSVDEIVVSRKNLSPQDSLEVDNITTTESAQSNNITNPEGTPAPVSPAKSIDKKRRFIRSFKKLVNKK